MKAKKPPVIKQTEADLLRMAAAYLSSRGITWWRNPVQGSLYTVGSKTFMRPSPIKGFPDLSFLSRSGVLCCIELKTTKGRIRPEQVEWIDKLNAANAPTRIIRTFEELVEFVSYYYEK
jgi:hypothetical protein